jgi:hypothetical protein
MSSDSDESKGQKAKEMSKEERRKVMRIVFNKTSSSTGSANPVAREKTFSFSLSISVHSVSRCST